jgi:type VI secretion system secreted protein VgrG
VVTGCLNAGPNYLPAETPRHKSQVVLRTRSLRGGGDGYEHHNEILLDDAAKKELMSLHAGWDWKRKVRNDDVTEIDGSETRTVTGRQRVHVKGELLDHEADKDAKETIHGARTRQVDKDEKVTINGNQTVTLTKGGRRVEIAGKATVIAHADREVQVEGNELHHVHHERTEVVDDKLVIRQGDTTVTLTEGTVDVHAAASLKLHHAGATVEIDEDGNVTVSTDKELKLIGDGAAITLGDGKAALSAELEMTLTVGGSAVKLDAGGVTTSGGNITSTANGVHQTTGTIVSQNC